MAGQDEGAFAVSDDGVKVDLGDKRTSTVGVSAGGGPDPSSKAIAANVLPIVTRVTKRPTGCLLSCHLAGVSLRFVAQKALAFC